MPYVLGTIGYDSIGASPIHAGTQRHETYACPNNMDTCEWYNYVDDNGYKYYFRKKWCDGQIKVISYGKWIIIQEVSCDDDADKWYMIVVNASIE